MDNAMDILLTKLDDAIHDMEAGRVQTIEEAWKEIDEIEGSDYRYCKRRYQRKESPDS